MLKGGWRTGAALTETTFLPLGFPAPLPAAAYHPSPALSPYAASWRQHPELPPPPEEDLRLYASDDFRM